MKQNLHDNNWHINSVKLSMRGDEFAAIDIVYFEIRCGTSINYK